jgi:peptidoglycan/xylan/chitin deacetylase (PgdA/CDA1 family)
MTALRVCAAAIVGLALVSGARGASVQRTAREVAVTIDDLPTVAAVRRDIESARKTTSELIAALKKHAVPAIGFVNEGKLDGPAGHPDPDRVALLRQWLDAGLELGNHTRTHVDLHRVTAQQFVEDVLAGEKVTRPLLREAGREPRFFRHPFLHTGRSADARSIVETALKAHGYRVAPVTVDNSDYLFAAAWDRAEARGDEALMRRISSTYLDYMASVFEFYEAQSRTIVGAEIRQILLLHASALNARTFDRLAARLAARGYTFVSLEHALGDPAYGRRDEYFGPAGITWLHRWALTDGRPGSTFAGEPAVPDWVQTAAR